MLAGDRRKKLTDWARWQTGAEGAGPDYCKLTCRRYVDGKNEPCEPCHEPELLPENVEAVVLFLSAQTQWRFAPSGFPTGLDYGGVEAAARLSKQELGEELFGKLQTLERAWVIGIRDGDKKRNPKDQTPSRRSR